MSILVINGPNLNMLGVREPDIYGSRSYEELCDYIRREAEALGVEVEFFQSNSEGDIVDAIQSCYNRHDGLVINPGGLTHSSIALPDAIMATGVPTVEVHISDPDTREVFRHLSYIRRECIATIKGKGFEGYVEAIKILLDKIN